VLGPSRGMQPSAPPAMADRDLALMEGAADES
jgi:hypothetical protein